MCKCYDMHGRGDSCNGKFGGKCACDASCSDASKKAGCCCVKQGGKAASDQQAKAGHSSLGKHMKSGEENNKKNNSMK